MKTYGALYGLSALAELVVEMWNAVNQLNIVNIVYFFILLYMRTTVCVGKNFRSLLIAVGLGQTLSLLICGTAVTSGLLQREHVLVPTGMYWVLTY